MAESLHDRIDEDRKRACPDARSLKLFRQYARGRNPATLNTLHERVLRGVLGNLFCDNVVRRVLQETRNRLRLARFEVEASTTEAGRVLDYLKSVWTLNHLTALSAETHFALSRDGNTCIGVAWTNGRVRLARMNWWDGDTGVFVAYDTDGQAAYAVREWLTTAGVKRRTVWFPDRIERFVQNGEGWTPTRLASDPANGAIAWTDRTGQPLGIPVVHFVNAQLPDDPDGSDGKLTGESANTHYGVSMADGGLLGLQDEINDIHRDVTAAARFVGYQMLWGKGIRLQKDEQGNDIPLVVEPGSFITDDSADAEFGVLPAGSLAELERALAIKLQAVARLTGIPTYLIAGDFPSGEALMRAEMPLIDSVETMAGVVGPAWASVCHKATRLANTFGNAGLNEDAMITSVFDPAARRDPLTLADIATKRAPFVSRREVLRTMNYSPGQQDRILDEMATEDVVTGVDQ